MKLNQQPIVISPNNFPNFLAWLPGSETVLIYENDKENCTKILQESEIVFTLDFNALHRTGEMEHVLRNLTVPMVMIDHHQKPDTFTMSIPSMTYPKTACFPSKFGVGPKVIKNCEPLVFGPEFAMETVPTLLCFNSVISSLKT